MAENVNWKQTGDVLKTEGNILEIGSFISRSGNKVDITSEDAKNLFNNIDASLPFVISHEGIQEEIGYATDFTENELGIAHKGIVFNNEKFKNAIAMGYNSISPEIDFEKDSDGKIVSAKIVKLAFVPNPAMKQNKVNMTRFAFSAPEVNSMTVPVEQPTETINIQGAQVPANTFEQPAIPTTPSAFDPQEFAKNIAASIVEGFSTKIGSQLEAMQQEIASIKSNTPTVTAETLPPEITENLTTLVTDQKPDTVPRELIDQIAKLQADNKSFQERIEKEEKTIYANKLAELRSLGQENPEKLVAHLKDNKSKIETLDALKIAIVKNQPMNSPQSQPLGVEGGKNQSMKQPTVQGLADSLKMQLDQATAERIAKRLRIPVQ